MKLNLIILVLLLSFGPAAISQSLLKKAKEKVNQGSKVLRDIKGNGTTDDNNSSDNSEASNDNHDGGDYSNSRGGRPANTKGKKLSTTSINVNQEISNAEASLGKKEYGQTRNSIQQAILGIEVAMAYNILESLPDEVEGLKADEGTDHVAASGAGYNGLSVEREYFAEQGQEQNDYDSEEGERYMKFFLVNSSMYAAGVTAYITNPVYSSTTEGDKRIIQFKGINSLLEYSEYEGYKLSVPIGEETLVQFSCVNFEDENEVLKTADFFDIDKMKNYLGEK